MISVSRRRRESGQATVEGVAGFAVLLFTGVISLQLLLVGYAHQLADGAAHAAAVAMTRGEAARPAVEQALPSWAASRHGVFRGPGSVEVRIRPPAPDDRIARLLEVGSTAHVREALP